MADHLSDSPETGAGFFSLRRWRPAHLLMAWGAYWLALIPVGLSSPVLALWRLRRLGALEGSTLSAGVSDWVANLSVTRNGTPVWNGSVSLLAIALWAAGPPLALWLAWIANRPPLRHDESVLAPRSSDAAPAPLQSPAPGAAFDPRVAGHGVPAGVGARAGRAPGRDAPDDRQRGG
ncbi:MAG TPA: hypothetical protein VG916_12205 [Gemmatimonadaceae bacterium]|nr:hypothetical protein [Gemmatimonadaceae bacterium]